MGEKLTDYDDTEQAILDFLALRGTQKPVEGPTDKREKLERGAKVIFRISSELEQIAGKDGVKVALEEQKDIHDLTESIKAQNKKKHGSA